MMTTEHELSEIAQMKRLSAAENLTRARVLIEAAAEDMAMLEGPGYCENYEAVQKAQYDLGKRISAISALDPPTGIFQL